MKMWYAVGRKDRQVTNAALRDTLSYSKAEAVIKGREKYGPNRYTIHSVDAVENPSPELIYHIGSMALK